MTMTREDRLYSMKMAQLIEVAEAEGIKIDKKGSKAKAVEKILAYEAAAAEVRAEEAEALAEDFQTEETAVEETAEKTEQKKRRSKKSFEQLVAEIASPGNVRFVRAANGDVIVKRGNKRIFRYNGSTMIATTESRFAGCDYEKQNWNGYVIHTVTPEVIKTVFNNI